MHSLNSTTVAASVGAAAMLLGSCAGAFAAAPASAPDSPFLEDVQILHEWRGEGAEDQFGWIARPIGDVDGDGRTDFVTSAPTHGGGRIYVYSSQSGRLLWQADGRPGDELGTGVESAGDADCDGVPDVIASGPAGGIAHIYSGKDGRVLHTFHSSDSEESFGNHAAGLGDIDGDGCSDVIVGAPGKEGEHKIAGHAYIYSGKSGALLQTLQGESPGDAFGSTVAGRVIAGHQYVLVGAPGAGPRHTGRVYVYDHRSSQPVYVFDSDDTGRAFGLMFLSVVGDVDADGEPDFYASDWSNAAKGKSTGRIYIHSGRTGARLLTLTGATAGEGFGIGPGIAGDVDGDGHADLVIGSWQYGQIARSAGRVYLYSGRTGALLRTYTDRVAEDTFGFDAVGMGDIDGDGTVDLLITAAWSGINGHRSGRVFLISSGVRREGPAGGSPSASSPGPARRPASAARR